MERLNGHEPYHRPEMTEAQDATLRRLCERYKVPFDPEHYVVWPEDSSIMPGWCEGWLGGPNHAAHPELPRPAHPALKPTLYVGVDPEGRAHS